jgi:sugar/nucleoside kinase (ribokinase family)
MRKVAARVKCENMTVTRGSNGALSLVSKGDILGAPALATNVVDPVGAGDAFLAFTAPLVAMGVPRDLVLFIGNAVGALAVQIVCNREPVDLVDLKKFIATMLK